MFMTQYPLGSNPLKFWIQNVLPVVYEDDLSYMELVSKLVRYYNSLRDIMEKQGEIDAQMGQQIAAIEEWIEEFPAMEVETAVLNIMNEWKTYRIGAFDKLRNRELLPRRLFLCLSI